jgi:hypothetical protein
MMITTTSVLEWANPRLRREEQMQHSTCVRTSVVLVKEKGWLTEWLMRRAMFPLSVASITISSLILNSWGKKTQGYNGFLITQKDGVTYSTSAEHPPIGIIYPWGEEVINLPAE